MVSMRRFVKEVNVKATDPLISKPYNKYYFHDGVEKIKYLNDIEMCKSYVNNQKKCMLLNQKQV